MITLLPLTSSFDATPFVSTVRIAISAILISGFAISASAQTPPSFTRDDAFQVEVDALAGDWAKDLFYLFTRYGSRPLYQSIAKHMNPLSLRELSGEDWENHVRAYLAWISLFAHGAGGLADDGKSMLQFRRKLVEALMRSRPFWESLRPQCRRLVDLGRVADMEACRTDFKRVVNSTQVIGASTVLYGLSSLAVKAGAVVFKAAANRWFASRWTPLLAKYQNSRGLRVGVELTVLAAPTTYALLALKLERDSANSLLRSLTVDFSGDVDANTKSSILRIDEAQLKIRVLTMAHWRLGHPDANKDQAPHFAELKADSIRVTALAQSLDAGLADRLRALGRSPATGLEELVAEQARRRLTSTEDQLLKDGSLLAAFYIAIDIIS